MKVAPALVQEQPLKDVSNKPEDGAEKLVSTAAVELDEDPKKKEKREKEELVAKMKQFGKPVSFMTIVTHFATGPELFIYGVGWFGAMIHGFCAPAMCIVFGDMLDAVGSAGFDMDMVGEKAMAFTVLGIVVIFSGWLQGFGFAWFAENMVRKLRPKYYEAALYMDIGWFDTHDAGALPAEMAQDMEDLAEALGMKTSIAVMAATQLIAGFVLAFYEGWLLAAVICVVVPFMGAGVGLMAGSMQEIKMETQGAYQQAGKVIEEVLFAVRTVVAFGGEQREIDRFGRHVEKARKGGVQSRTKAGLGMGYIWMMMFFCYAIAFYAGMLFVYHEVDEPGTNEDYTTGKIFGVFFAILTGGFSLGMIPPAVTAISQAKLSNSRVFWILRTDSVIQLRTEKENRKQLDTIEKIELKGVVFEYPAQPGITVLKGLNLEINRGQKVAVVGESGSGKSTVMALITRFYDPKEGQVLVNGENLCDFSVRSFRQQIGYVGQEPVLFATTMKKNIMQGWPEATDQDFKVAVNDAQVATFVKDLPDGYDTFVGSGGSQFSGGQKQRIAIARALLKRPSVLYLDEATSALDSTSERMIQETIDQIGQGAKGMTMVSIAHRLSTVRNSDVIYVLQGGRMAEKGSHNDLVQKKDGLYTALAAAQSMAEEVEEKEDAAANESRPTKTPSKEAVGGFQKNGTVGMQKADTKALAKNDDAEDAERMKVINKEYKVPMGRLMSYCKPEWCFFVPGLIAAAANGACMPLIGSYVMVDGMEGLYKARIDNEGMKKDVSNACIWFVVGAVVVFLANGLQFACFGMIGEGMTKRLRVELLTTVLRQEIGYHDDAAHTPSLLAKAFQTYCNRVSALCTSVGDKVGAVGSMLTGLVVAFVSSWQMALAILGSVPIMGVTQAIQFEIQMGGGKAKDESKSSEGAQQVLSDSIINARTVQALANERELVTLYSEMLGKTHKGYTRKHLLGGFVFGVSDAMQFFIMAFGFWFLGWLIEEGHSDFSGGMKAFMGLMFAAFGGATAASMGPDLGKAKLAAHDMFELMDRKPLINGLEPDGKTPEGMIKVGQIEFRNVCFFYPFRPDVQVLQGLSFQVAMNTSVGLVGPSGGGKSTVMAMLQRFYDPQKGDILIGETKTPLHQLNIRWWRKQIGHVGQEPILFEGTVLHNVKYGLDADETVESARLAECKEMANLKFLDAQQGFNTEVGPRGARLSGGQKQRVAICRALIRNPAIMLLDEATSALDTQSEKLVSAALEKAMDRRTSFSIAHRLSTIQDCDVIMVVGEGRILESGTHGELMDHNGVYCKLQKQSQSRT